MTYKPDYVPGEIIVQEMKGDYAYHSVMKRCLELDAQLIDSYRYEGTVIGNVFKVPIGTEEQVITELNKHPEVRGVWWRDAKQENLYRLTTSLRNTLSELEEAFNPLDNKDQFFEKQQEKLRTTLDKIAEEYYR